MTLAGKVCSSVPETVGPACGNADFAGGAFQRHAFAGPHQIHGAQSQNQRDGGENFEIDDGFDADAAHGLDAAGAGDAVHQQCRRSAAR